jgi:curved DNA-binding protein CbpA
MKDYYVILGVLPDAEDVVIKAAYKALVQRYHPDRFKGNAQEAQRKTAELNEAYEILSNPQKRAEYDRTPKASQGNTSDYDDDEESGDGYSSFQELDENWQFALEYYPDLALVEARLRKISVPLSIGFRQAILSTKAFDQRQQIAKVLEQRFLENYFGTNPKVLEFALKLILDGKKAGAKELNKAISILGSNNDPQSMIDKLYQKHYAEKIAAEQEKEKQKREREKREGKLALLAYVVLIVMMVGFTLSH